MTPTPAAGEIPSTERRALARRIGAAVSAPSGFVLALCFFMPAVDACDEVHYPYRYPEFFEPYLFGLATAIFTAALLLHAKPFSRIWSRIFSIYTGLSISAYGFFFFKESGIHHLEISQTELFLALPSLPALALTLTPLSYGRPPLIVFARNLWVGGTICCLWFCAWWRFSELDPEQALYGLHLSVLTSAFLALGGALLEWGARGQERVRDSSLRSE